jgi:hypothetical protein
MKLVIITVCIFFSLTVLFSSCKNNGAENSEKINKDSLAKAALSKKVVSEFSKYLISPPDSDYTGDYMDKYPNGIIKFNGFFRFGKRHGQWMAFYENGIKWSECFYDKGKKHGSTMVYHPNGNLYYSGWYKQDEKDSLWFFYDDKGKELDRRAFRLGVETGLVN